MSNSENSSKLPKNPRFAIVASIILGLGLQYLGYYIYQDILQWEITGGTKRMQWIIYAVYEVLGAKGVWALISLGGIYLLYNAYNIYKKLKG